MNYKGDIKQNHTRKLLNMKQSSSSDIYINSDELKEQPLIDNNKQDVSIKPYFKRPIPDLISREEIVRKQLKMKQLSKCLEEVPSYRNQSSEYSHETHLYSIANSCLSKKQYDKISVIKTTASTSGIDNPEIATDFSLKNQELLGSEHLRSLTIQARGSDSKPQETFIHTTNHQDRIVKTPYYQRNSKYLHADESYVPYANNVSTSYISSHSYQQNQKMHETHHSQFQRYKEGSNDARDWSHINIVNNSAIPNLETKKHQIGASTNFHLFGKCPQASATNYVSHPVPHDKNIFIQKSTDTQAIDKNNYLHSNMKNVPPTEKCFSKNHIEPLLTADGPYLYRDLNEQEIYSGRPINVINNNHEIFPQTDANTYSAQQDNYNLQKLINYVCETNIQNNHTSIDNSNYIQQEQHTQCIPDKMYENYHVVQQHSNLLKTTTPSWSSNRKKQYIHLSEPAHKQDVLIKNKYIQKNQMTSQILIGGSNRMLEKNEPTNNKNKIQEKLLAPQALFGGSIKEDSMDQIGLNERKTGKTINVLENYVLPYKSKTIDSKQTVTSNIPSASSFVNKQNYPMSDNPPGQFSERLSEKEIPLVSKSYTLRDPRLQKANCSISSSESPTEMIITDSQNSLTQNSLLSTSSCLEDYSKLHRQSHSNSRKDAVVIEIQHQTPCILETNDETSIENIEKNNKKSRVWNKKGTKMPKQASSNKKRLFERPRQKLQSRKKTIGHQKLTKKVPVIKIKTCIESGKNNKSNSNESSAVSSTCHENKEDILIDILKHFMVKINFSVPEILKIVDQERRSTHEFDKTTHLTLKTIEQFCKLKNKDSVANAATHNSNNNFNNATNIIEEKRKKIKKKDKFNYYYDSDYEFTDTTCDTEDSDDDFKVPKRYQMEIKTNSGGKTNVRTFVLPPEFDRYDSKWTLQHHKASPGLVELVPNTGVYINKIKLANCKRISKDYTTLARMLLIEIFTQNALSVCSLTGAKANAFNRDVRPGLDENARSVILTYVQEYGREQGWGHFDLQAVLSSLRSKIQDMRAKYGKNT